MRVNLDWAPYYEIAKKDWPYAEKLAAYAKLAEQRLDSERFEEFCAKHLPHLDQVAWEFFASDRAIEAVRLKVAALYPPHEVDQFTTLFWNRIQHWREQTAPGAKPATAAAAPAVTPVTAKPAAPSVAAAPAVAIPKGATASGAKAPRAAEKKTAPKTPRSKTAKPHGGDTAGTKA
jgi:hypothetical protein